MGYVSDSSPRDSGFRGVHVPTNWVLGFWGIVTILQVLGQYMIIRHLDTQGVLWDSGPRKQNLGFRHQGSDSELCGTNF